MMSSALLRKSLALCDPDTEEVNSKNKLTKKAKKVTARVTKLNKHQSLQTPRKVTVNEARAGLKAQDQVKKDNLERMKLNKKICTVKLNKEIIDQVIERAISRKPVTRKPVEQPEEKTAFTEEDFKKFEDEYLDY